ncbi:uncharacterized protein TRIADDRAFT_62115 [Trichoplax adhaerens]|uniref:Uncharacterized protein n=1 Tax=Trichoplax adhaerens TaxID=10228 RepID=B3SCW1_TRIAD|nr:predicted protein [Trichoplax adhaerens]EDV19413.1 predicted protein [Trichoplax adhaerens]|eukprot:XP_002118102.1 predicted protein [Trichoplax adhaerens]
MSASEDEMNQSCSSAKAFYLGSKHERLLKNFMISCINKFIAKITLYSAIAKGDKDIPVTNFQRLINDLVKPIVSLLGSEIALPVNIGLSVISYTSYQIKRKLAKDKARKITDALDTCHHSILLIVSLIVCDVCRMFQNQIIMITEADATSNKEVLTNAIVNRVLNYVSKNKLADDARCIVKAHETTFSEVLEVARIGITGLFEGESKKSSKVLKINYNGTDREITCGNLLKLLPVLIENQRITCHRKDFEKQYEKIWGNRKSSLLAEPCFSFIPSSKDSKVDSEEYSLETLHPADLKSNICESQLSKVVDIESLSSYSIYLLKMSLCDSKTGLIMDAVKDIRNLAEKIDRWQEFCNQVKDALDQLTQLPTKTEVELLINPIYAELKRHESKSRDMQLQIDAVHQDTKNLLRFNADLLALVKDINSRKARMPTKDPNTLEILQHVPHIGTTEHLIVRKDFQDRILEALTKIQYNSGHVLVYGIGGCGNINEDKLLQILNKLTYEISINIPNELRKSLPEFCNAIEGALYEKYGSTSEILFIFDDIWSENYIKYLKFTAKAIVISRLQTDFMKSMHNHVVKASENFTFNEAVHVLHSYQSSLNLKDFLESEYISKIIDYCKGLPLAIALIGGQRIETAEGWRNVLSKIQRSDAVSLPYYRFNLYETFAASIEELSATEKILLRKLAVFIKGNIPLRIIGSFWELSREDTARVLRNFHDRSLLMFSYERNSNKKRASQSVSNLILQLQSCQRVLKEKKSDISGLKDICSHLQRHCSYIHLEALDFIQFLLSASSSTSWLYGEALNIAKKRSNKRDYFYTIIRKNPESFGDRKFISEHISTCQIKILEVENLLDYSILEVPEFIDLNGCKAIPDSSITGTICNLESVKAASDSIIFLNYGFILGILHLNFGKKKSLNLVEGFSEVFQKIFGGSFINSVAISDTERLAAALVNSGLVNDILVFQFQGRTITRKNWIKCNTGTAYIEFLNSGTLTAYNEMAQVVYFFHLNNAELCPSKKVYDSRKVDYRVIEADFAFVNGVPVISKVKTDLQGNTLLEMKINRGMDKYSCKLRRKSISNLGTSYKQYFHNEMSAVLIEEIYKCTEENCTSLSNSHWHTYLTMRSFPSINIKKWTQNLVFTLDVTKCRTEFLFQKSEDNLVFAKWIPRKILYISIFHFETGDLLTSLTSDDNHIETRVYLDDNNLIFYCRQSDQKHYIKQYFFYNGEIIMNHSKWSNYRKDSSYISILTTKRPRVSFSDLIEINGTNKPSIKFEKEWNLFMNCEASKIGNGILFFTKKGENFVIYSHEEVLYVKGSLNFIRYFRINLCFVDNLWGSDYFIYVNNGKIYVHRTDTMDIVQVFQSPQLNTNSQIKSNNDQSILICRDFYPSYSILERVTSNSIA